MKEDPFILKHVYKGLGFFTGPEGWYLFSKPTHFQGIHVTEQEVDSWRENLEKMLGCKSAFAEEGTAFSTRGEATQYMRAVNAAEDLERRRIQFEECFPNGSNGKKRAKIGAYLAEFLQEMQRQGYDTILMKMKRVSESNLAELLTPTREGH